MPIDGKNLVVSITTYPERINLLKTTLKSIFNQTLKADIVVLYLSKEQFPNEFEEIPEYLKTLVNEGKLLIRFVPRDIRSHKKYFYAMQEYRNDLVVVIDDDIIFDKDMLSLLVESYKKHPNAVSAMRTHLILTEDDAFKGYNSWIKEVDGIIDVPSMQLYATNGAGTLYDPTLYKDDLFDEQAIMDTCIYADDMWMKANELISGIPVVMVCNFRPIVSVDGTQEISPLWKINNTESRNVQWKAIEDHFDKKYGEKNILFNRLKSAGIMADSELLEVLLAERNKGRKRERAFVRNANKLKKSNKKLKKENTQLKAQVNSKAYKLGNALAAPIRFIKREIRK